MYSLATKSSGQSCILLSISLIHLPQQMSSAFCHLAQAFAPSEAYCIIQGSLEKQNHWDISIGGVREREREREIDWDYRKWLMMWPRSPTICHLQLEKQRSWWYNSIQVRKSKNQGSWEPGAPIFGSRRRWMARLHREQFYPSPAFFLYLDPQ